MIYTVLNKLLCLRHQWKQRSCMWHQFDYIRLLNESIVTNDVSLGNQSYSHVTYVTITLCSLQTTLIVKSTECFLFLFGAVSITSHIKKAYLRWLYQAGENWIFLEEKKKYLLSKLRGRVKRWLTKITQTSMPASYFPNLTPYQCFKALVL